ncbi:DUF6397 family protein [Streptomyces purpureus]|uniref:DUF6397 family protein n=1 Tax=Streptomyces purpureus TaxID=1951 RepID=UPI0003738145|nr:DUF6397 family protein [Streptomyces purpureus]
MTVTEAVRTLAFGRAAQQLELRRGELELAVQLGHVRSVPGAPGTRPRVTEEEVGRLRRSPDFPEGLRERVRAVGTTEAAALLGVPPDRFTRLARTGHISPVRFYLNRYRAVVWLYLAGEVREFGAGHSDLLTGRLPQELRTKLDDGVDHRPRNWRTHRLGLLLRGTDDPWEQAAAIASLLDPVQLAEVVADPYERAYLDRLRPDPPYRPESASARELADRLMLADDPDEILWHRTQLGQTLGRARVVRAAPRPESDRTAAVAGVAPGGRARPLPLPPMTALPERVPLHLALPRPPVPHPPVRRVRRVLLDRLLRRREARATR